MRAHRLFALLGICLLATACKPAPTPEEKAAADARDIAMVEAAQERHPPLQPLSPQPITAGDIERLGLLGKSCGFVPDGQRDPMMLAFENKAALLLDGRATMLASDGGGPAGPLGTWQHYVGKAISLRVTRAGGDGVEPGSDALEWAAVLTLRDEFDRIVYTRPGKLRCGA